LSLPQRHQGFPPSSLKSERGKKIAKSLKQRKAARKKYINFRAAEKFFGKDKKHEEEIDYVLHFLPGEGTHLLK